MRHLGRRGIDAEHLVWTMRAATLVAEAGPGNPGDPIPIGLVERVGLTRRDAATIVARARRRG